MLSQRGEIFALMKDATSSITLSEINEKHKVPTTHAYSSKHAIDRTITMGKVEGSVEALREAVKKLEEGGSIEDARAVCGPGLLNEMMKWKSKLRVYLAPFLHGMRYTSFGRHFTKMDKLEKVVDKLHWYAEEGDMIVDFCCGANCKRL
ncbi:Protein ENHANCED DOWNY MILDEW 2 [Orobanche minor]